MSAPPITIEMFSSDRDVAIMADGFDFAHLSPVAGDGETPAMTANLYHELFLVVAAAVAAHQWTSPKGTR